MNGTQIDHAASLDSGAWIVRACNGIWQAGGVGGVLAADHGKAFERRHAKRFIGGKRIVRPDFGIEGPDGESPSDVWECRDRKAITVVSWFRERKEQYASWTGDRRFHLAFHIPGQKTDYVMLEADDYAHLVWCEGKLGLLRELGCAEES